MSETKTVYNRKGEKKVLTDDGSMESLRHRVKDAVEEINYDNARRGKKEITAEKLVGNSRAAKYISKSFLITNNPLAKGGKK